MWPKSPSRCKYEFHLTEARHAPPADPPPPPPQAATSQLCFVSAAGQSCLFQTSARAASVPTVFARLTLCTRAAVCVPVCLDLTISLRVGAAQVRR